MARPKLSAAFGAIVRQHRAKRNLSQERLAEIADLHRNYVGMLNTTPKVAAQTVPCLPFVLVLSAAVLVIDATVLPDMRRSIRHAREHRHDPVQKAFARLGFINGERVANREDIDTGRALQGRAPRNLEEPLSVSQRTLAVTFGDVLRNRLRGAQQLVARMPVGTRQSPGHLEGPGNELERKSIHIELFVVEGHRASITSTSTRTNASGKQPRVRPGPGRRNYSCRSVWSEASAWPRSTLPSASRRRWVSSSKT